MKSDCIISKYWKDKDGYPVTIRKGKTIRVARDLYQKEFGKLKKGIVVDHLCRNRECINIKHLEAVTIAENTRRGKAAKITQVDAKRIKELYKMKKITQTELGKIYKVGQDEISRIINGWRWA